MTCSAVTRDGIEDLWNVVLEHDAAMKNNGWFEKRRREQVRKWMNGMIEWGLRDRFRQHPEIEKRLPEFEHDVSGRADQPLSRGSAAVSTYTTEIESEFL